MQEPAVYETTEAIDTNGVVHLFDDESCGFPLCGANVLFPEGTARRVPCRWCREAAARERRARRLFPRA